MLIDVDRIKLGKRLPAAYEHRRHGFLDEHAAEFLQIAKRRDEDDAVDPATDHVTRDLELVIARLAFLEHELNVELAGLIEAADQKLAQEPGAGV